VCFPQVNVTKVLILNLHSETLQGQSAKEARVGYGRLPYLRAEMASNVVEFVRRLKLSLAEVKKMGDNAPLR